jgi:hypothetical protein
MTKDEYRQHMRTYSRDTMALSFVDTKHLDYQALREAGKEIVQYLLEDLVDPDWYCQRCYGYGYEFVPTWGQETYPPRSTGNPCPECKGKGVICSWACLSLLADIVGDDRPKIENSMRGCHDDIVKVWRKWGEENGYLPKTLDAKRVRGVFVKIREAVLSLFQ